MGHYCKEHETVFFKKGKMRGYAHPIGDTGEWCNEPEEGGDEMPAGDTGDRVNENIRENMEWKSEQIEHAQDMRFLHEWLLEKERENFELQLQALKDGKDPNSVKYFPKWTKQRTEFLAGLYDRLEIKLMEKE